MGLIIVLDILMIPIGRTARHGSNLMKSKGLHGVTEKNKGQRLQIGRKQLVQNKTKLN